MKKIILLLFCFTVMLFANIYDTKTIQEDFKAGNVDKYNYDALPLLDKNVVKIKYLAATGAGSYISAVPNVDDYTTPSSNILEVFKCPKGGMGYSTTVYSVDFATLSMTCMVARAGALEKPLGLFPWSLTDYGSGYKPWVNYFEKNVKKAALDNEDIINASKIQFSGLEAARVGAKNASEAAGANTGIPKIIFGTLLGDTGLIDVQSSINHSAIVLNEGNIVKGSNFLKTKSAATVSNSDVRIGDVWNVNVSDTGDWLGWIKNVVRAVAPGEREVIALKVDEITYENEDKSSDIITSRLINLLEFYPKFSQLSQDFYMTMLGALGVFGVLFYTSQKIGNPEDKSPNHIYMGGIIAMFIIFFPANSNNIVAQGEELKVSQNNFTKFEVMGYYTAVDFANGIANIVIDNEMNSIARRAGAINANTIIDVSASEEIVKKERIAALGALIYCRDTYHLEYVQKYSEKNFVFPKSEQYVYAQYIKKGLYPNIYDSINNNGLLVAENPLKHFPKISISGCNKIEKKLDYLEKMSEKNEATLAAATTGISNGKIKMLEHLYHSQYSMFNEWEYMSIIALPTIVYKSESLERLFGEKEMDSATKNLNENDGAIDDFIQSTPYFLVPGTQTFYQIFKDNSDKLLSLGGAAVGSVVPGVGTVAGGVVGKVLGATFSEAIAFIFTTMTIKNFLSVLPIVGIIMLGLLINLKIIIKVFTYHLMAPFVLLLCFSKQNVQLALNYVARVITIMFEIPIFVLSIFAAMAARDILLAVGTPMSSTVLKIMNELNNSQSGSLLDSMLDNFMIGLIEMSLQIFAFIIIYKILSTYHTQVFEAMEVKTAAAFDGAINETISSAQAYGQRL